MATVHTLLDPASFSPAAQRALVPGPAQLMAARGLVPLPRPGELVSVLYQLVVDPAAAAAIREAAVGTLRNLPERVLAPALADDSVDPRVLDYLAGPALGSGLWKSRPQLAQAVVLNRATADETVAGIAAECSAQVADIIAQNEQRMLRHPAIVRALYHNRQARMSTVDRALELAVRAGIVVDDIPGWEAIVGAILGTLRDPNAGRAPEEADAIFAQVTQVAEAAVAQIGPARSDSQSGDASDSDGGDGQEDSQPVEKEVEEAVKIPLAMMSVPQKIRMATLGNSFARSVLIRDPNRIVATAAIKAPGVAEIEVARYASNHSLSDDVIKYIASRREWTRTYGVKVSLINNPKTAIADAMRFMPHLRERELRVVARSKNVPSVVAAQARKLLTTRGRGPQGK